jgi:hypothetical protein
LLAVAEARPDVFQDHILPHMSSATKRALNASCRFASRHVRPAVTSITYTTAARKLPGSADPTARYPAISELCLDLSVSSYSVTFPTDLEVQTLQTLSQHAYLLQQLKRLKLRLQYACIASGTPDMQSSFARLLDCTVRQCVQLEQLTLQGLSGNDLCWKAQLPSGSLHALLPDLLSALHLEHLVSASCSIQTLAEVSIVNAGDLLETLFDSLAKCTALERLHVMIEDSRAAKAVLKFSVNHMSLRHARILLICDQPAFDTSDASDRALLHQLESTCKDLSIMVQRGDDELESGARSLQALCRVIGVDSLTLFAGDGSPCLRDTWTHFLLVQSLDLGGLLLDDHCVAALNRLTLLKHLELTCTEQSQHQLLSRDIHLPLLTDLRVNLDYTGHEGMQESVVSDPASWQGAGEVTDILQLSDNLACALHAPQLRQLSLNGGVVPAQAFLQLQRRSPHLQVELCRVVLLVDDMQLAAVAKHCPVLISTGSCIFRGITHYGLLSTATASGSSLKELCGSGKRDTWCTLQQVTEQCKPLPVQADDSSILVLAQRCTNLTKLQLHSTSNAFTKQSILHIAGHLPSLRVLELLGCKGLDDSCLSALFSRCPGLAHLSLDGLGCVPEVALCVPLLELQHLQTLVLSGAEKLTIDGLRMLITRSKAIQSVQLLSLGVHNASATLHRQLLHTSQAVLDTWGSFRITAVQVQFDAAFTMWQVDRS